MRLLSTIRVLVFVFITHLISSIAVFALQSNQTRTSYALQHCAHFIELTCSCITFRRISRIYQTQFKEISSSSAVSTLKRRCAKINIPSRTVQPVFNVMRNTDTSQKRYVLPFEEMKLIKKNRLR